MYRRTSYNPYRLDPTLPRTVAGCERLIATLEQPLPKVAGYSDRAYAIEKQTERNRLRTITDLRRQIARIRGEVAA